MERASSVRVGALMQGALVMVTLCVGCVPPLYPGDGELRDVGIRNVATTTEDLGGDCFLVNLSYDILPYRENREYEVTYSFSQEAYQVKGLDGHMVRRDPSGAFKVSRAFEVCQGDRAGTRVFLFEILARSPTDFFRAFPGAISVRGSGTWDFSLKPTVEALRAELDKGPRTPNLLRQYWRALAAFFHGGYRAYDAAVDRRIQEELGEFDKFPEGSVIAAYRSIVKENGGYVDITFNTGFGLVTAVRLNEAYQVGANYQADVLALLGSGPLRDLLGLDSGDSLVVTDDELSEAARTLVLERYRGGVRVVPDRVNIVLSPSFDDAIGPSPAAGWVIEYITSDIGRVGQASCARALAGPGNGGGSGGGSSGGSNNPDKASGKGGGKENDKGAEAAKSVGNSARGAGAIGSGSHVGDGQMPGSGHQAGSEQHTDQALGDSGESSAGAESDLASDVDPDAESGSGHRPKSALRIEQDDDDDDEPHGSLERIVLHRLEEGYRCVKEVFSVQHTPEGYPAAHHLMVDAHTGEIIKNVSVHGA